MTALPYTAITRRIISERVGSVDFDIMSTYRKMKVSNAFTVSL